MNILSRKTLALAVALALAGSLGACASYNRTMASGAPMLEVGHRMTLTGAQEVPAVTSAAEGKAVLLVTPDHGVSGSIETTGITATAAHIHEGAMGANGPVIVPMVKEGNNKFIFPAGSKLTDAQYDAYKAGRLYLNVHSAAHPGGEIRAQIGEK